MLLDKDHAKEILKTNRFFRLKYAIPAALAVLVIGVVLFRGGGSTEDDRYITVPVTRGDVFRTVSSTGVLQAVVTVQVGSQVSGRVQELYADFNSLVKKGQVLAIIDPASFEAQLSRSRAALAMARANVKNAVATMGNRRAELTSSKANLKASQVASQDAERALVRMRGLSEADLTSERQLEEAQAIFGQAVARTAQAAAQVEQIKAAIRSADAQLDQARATVQQAAAELRVAEVNLKYTKILAPIDGVVIERNVDIGQTVAASFQAPVLFLIANDLTRMQVIAQVDEADIGALSEEAEVEFTVDAFTRDTFPGKISEIRLSSTLPGASSSGSSTTSSGNASNVVTYNVVIDVENNDLKLRPSMTANVTFTVGEETEILKVANAALRFRPVNQPPSGKVLLASSLPDSGSAEIKKEGRGRRSTSEKSASKDGARSPRASSKGDRALRRGKRPAEKKAEARQAVQRNGNIAMRQHYATERYGIRPGVKIHFPQAADVARPRGATLWKLNDVGELESVRVRLGLTNGRETAVLEGELEEGDWIVTGEYLTVEEGGTGGPRSPFGGRFGGRSRRSGSTARRTNTGRRR